jgi:hypothetical protein
MFYEYAIDPDLLADASTSEALVRDLASHDHRLIAGPERAWRKESYHHIKNCNLGDIKKRTITNRLNKMKFTHRLDKNRTLTEPLLDFFLREHQVRPYAAIMSEQASETDSIFTFSDLLDRQPPGWEEHPSATIENSPDALFSLVSPLLLLSKQIDIVDPYLAFTKPNWLDYQPFLDLLCSNSNSYCFGRGLDTVRLHTSTRYGNMEDSLRKLRQEGFAAGITIKVNHWPKEEMHDRFLITEIGAIQVGSGFGLSPNNNREINVFRASKETATSQRSKIQGKPVLTYTSKA